MVDDARLRTKVYLETWLNNANLMKDNDTSQVAFIVAYGNPDYPLTQIFNDKNVDLVFSIGDPDSEAIADSDHYPIGYKETVPIIIFCVDKTGITGAKLRWKAEAELRRVIEQHPEGSQRSLEKIRDNDKNLGSTILYSREFALKYVRDTT